MGIDASDWIGPGGWMGWIYKYQFKAGVLGLGWLDAIWVWVGMWCGVVRLGDAGFWWMVVLGMWDGLGGFGWGGPRQSRSE